MISKLRAFASLYRELGPRWTLFRLAYAFRLRTGLIRLQMPMGEWSDYKNLISTNPAGRVERAFFPLVSRSHLSKATWNPQPAIAEANRILGGELKYFSRQYIQTGFPPNWHTDYVTLSRFSGEGSLPPSSEILRSAQNDTMKHWSQIPHDSSTDIKFIWEPNRFAFIYTLVRAYAASQDEKYPEAFWTLIEDWAQHNPPNTGPNWMDGQEIALRLMAWTFGFFQFSNSPSSTPQRKEQFLLYIAAQAERIYKNIGYAISTRSNHTISEAFGLWMVGLLFPELKHAEKYLSLGKRLLEQEAANQIFPDGTYSMYSLNYHRFILHIYLYAIHLGEVNNSPFSNSLYSSISSSLEYLSHLINPETGEMPAYGSNDGALVLPLNNCDFTDYRPLLQLGWYITKGERLFEPGPWDEDLFWICGDSLTAKYAKSAKEENNNLSELRAFRGESFPNGGVYLLHNTHSHALLHCTDHTSRPSHADQLHVDLWIHGHNLVIDAGTYLYSGEGIWRNGLARTPVHNTVTVDGKDQMTLLSRFTWTNWSKGKVLRHEKDLWQGEHDGYKPVSHKRTVMALGGDRWLVIDNLAANAPHHYALQWLLADFPFEQKDNLVLLSLNGMKYKVQIGMSEGDGRFSLVRADPNSTRGWRSRYYGHKEPAISVMLEVNQPQVTFWTFFGFENDVIEAEGNVLKINSKIVAS
ncbi:MAG: heparinase II/III family protein [Anaerolineales bacterium]|nr:heparinase II/III family protein [Anaerolineales bacterium]